jgi:hypothetical protein
MNMDGLALAECHGIEKTMRNGQQSIGRMTPEGPVSGFSIPRYGRRIGTKLKKLAYLPTCIFAFSASLTVESPKKD